MSIEFRRVSCGPLQGFDGLAPSGAVIGVVGEDGAGKGTLVRLAAGEIQPAGGEVLAPGRRRLIGTGGALDFSPVDALLLDHALARHDAVERRKAAVAIDRLRRAGCTVLLVSHEEELLAGLCDEVWWLRQGMLAARGDPGTVLDAYLHDAAGRLRAWGETVSSPLAARWRRGDGRAEVLAIETVGENGQPTLVLRSGELALVRVTIRFRQAVEDPVAGMMIRTRVGLSVYGTNTELEKLKLGPRQAGDVLRVSFAFRCELCPGEYTLTAASHDPDGVWHDWLEDAVAFSVADCRYTAGVANLRARITVESSRPIPE